MIERIDFSKVREYYISLESTTDRHLVFFDKIVSYYNENLEITIDKLEKLFDYYNYTNRFLFSNTDEDIPVLKFVFSDSEFNIITMLTFKDGVSDVSDNFKNIIEEPIFDNFNFVFHSNEAEDTFYESIWNLKFIILHVWLTYIWINLDFHTCGLIVCISDSQCSDFFYLNDMKWNFESFYSKENSYPLVNSINYKLEVFEILKQLLIKPEIKLI